MNMKKISPMHILVFTTLTAALSLNWACSTSNPKNSSNRYVADGEDATPAPPPWAYDAGPDLTTPMGRELEEIMSSIPDFRTVSGEVMEGQKFRYFFGPVMWRMMLQPNSIKILFIGQDATHIAEAANRPATAGYGGRLQDLAEYFGVKWGLACINTFAGTIYGQYGYPDAPIISKGADGSASVQNRSVVDNPLWLIAQDQSSPIVQWRNRLIDWIIRNNHESLQMVVTFGGAARDTMASYLESKGAKVGTKSSRKRLENIFVPKMKSVGTGGNGETGYPVDTEGNDLYAKALGRDVDYTNPTDLKAAQKAFADAVAKNPKKWYKLMGESGNSGVLHPGQIGGYDLDNQLEINGKKTISLQGLEVGGKPLQQHIPVVALPHPTRLSKMTKEEAAAEVKKSLERVQDLVKEGWKIKRDAGLKNSFADGESYAYGRGSMDASHYDWGTPNSRMVAVSSASRMKADTIVFGTRDKVTFDKKLLDEMKKATPSEYPDPNDLWNMHGRGKASRGKFDPGPPERFAEIMYTNIPDSLRESHSMNGDFSHYRGTFNKPRAVILADPRGYDDLITSRALTGARGQYLNGLMHDLGYGEQYLVLNTAPFSLVRNDVRDFQKIVKETYKYREEILAELFKGGIPEIIIADGPFAMDEMQRMFGKDGPFSPEKMVAKYGPDAKVPWVTMRRSSAHGEDYEVEKTANEIKDLFPELRDKVISGKMRDIPRSHLCYVSRVWEGTSGDRVITSNDPKYIGKAFAEVIPHWAANQKNIFRSEEEILLTEILKAKRDGVNYDRLLADLQALREGHAEAVAGSASRRRGLVDTKPSCAKLFQ